MGFILSTFLAYFGIHAGVLLGSFAAEELPVGRYRLRLVQLIIVMLMAFLLLYEVAALQHYVALVFLAGLLFVETAFLFDRRATKFLAHPKDRMLLSYGLLAFIATLSHPTLQILYISLIFLYGLVSGSLIAEPYVEDRKLVPWDRPYHVAFKWSWSYLFVWIVIVIFSLSA